MKNFFESYNQNELELMFHESEQSINKTGQFMDGDYVYQVFLEYQEKDNKAMPFIFLMELYYEICKRLLR